VDPEELIHLFNDACSDILDHVAPYKLRRYKTKTLPWLNENTQLQTGVSESRTEMAKR